MNDGVIVRWIDWEKVNRKMLQQLNESDSACWTSVNKITSSESNKRASVLATSNRTIKAVNVFTPFLSINRNVWNDAYELVHTIYVVCSYNIFIEPSNSQQTIERSNKHGFHDFILFKHRGTFIFSTCSFVIYLEFNMFINLNTIYTSIFHIPFYLIISPHLIHIIRST